MRNCETYWMQPEGYSVPDADAPSYEYIGMWLDDGSEDFFISRDGAESPYDIIAEWQDEPEHIGTLKIDVDTSAFDASVDDAVKRINGAFTPANAQALLCHAATHLITDGEYSRAIAVLQILEGMDE